MNLPLSDKIPITVKVAIVFVAALVLFINFNTLIAASPTPKPTSPPENFPNLSPGFDGNFRFLNEYNLTGKLAFTANINGYDRILSLNFEQKRIDKIIDGPGNNFYPSWSPDGKFIAFVSDRDGDLEIYISDSNGEGVTRITNNNLENDHPSWSADGKELYYYQQTGGDNKKPQGNIFSYSIESKTSKQITKFSYKNSTPKMSPDGSLLAFSTNRFWPGWDICFLDMKTKKENCPLSGTATFCRPSWSNDGRYLAYSTGLFSDVDGAVYEVNTREDIDSWSTTGNDYDLVWSPDDKFIVFSSDADKRDVFNLYVYPREENPEGKTYPLLRAPYSLRFLSWVGTSQLSNKTPAPESNQGAL